MKKKKKYKNKYCATKNPAFIRTKSNIYTASLIFLSCAIPVSCVIDYKRCTLSGEEEGGVEI